VSVTQAVSVVGVAGWPLASDTDGLAGWPVTVGVGVVEVGVVTKWAWSTHATVSASQ